MDALRIAVSSAHRVKIALFFVDWSSFIRTMIALGDLVYSDAALVRRWPPQQDFTRWRGIVALSAP
jgi:hypothetical protein